MWPLEMVGSGKRNGPMPEFADENSLFQTKNGEKEKIKMYWGYCAGQKLAEKIDYSLIRENFECQ